MNLVQTFVSDIGLSDTTKFPTYGSGKGRVRSGGTSFLTNRFALEMVTGHGSEQITKYGLELRDASVLGV